MHLDRSTALLQAVQLFTRVASGRDPEGTLHAILDAAIEITGAERASICRLAEDGAITFESARHADGRTLVAKDRESSRTIVREALETGKPLLRHDVSGDPAASGSAREKKLLSLVAVPLVASEKQLGAILVEDRRRARAFGADHVWIMELFAPPAALVLATAQREAELERQLAENRRLTDLLAAKNETLEAERKSITRRLARRGEKVPVFPRILGEHELVRALRILIDKACRCDVTVLIEGETGTGKELVARSIHEHSDRARKPFLALNMTAFSPQLAESELFGHVKGAFTGATSNALGVFRAAEGGVVFLDEIGDMPLDVQAKLLRFLQDRTVRPIGSEKTYKVDVRIVAATNRDLAQRVAEGLFREDLYYRLRVLSIEMPPLRKRMDDLPILVKHFLARAAKEHKRAVPKITREARLALEAHFWPGNVRELEATIHRLVVSDVDPVKPEHLTLSRERRSPGRIRRLEEIEREAILSAIESLGPIAAAKALGVSRWTLRRKLDKWGLPAHASL